MNPAYDYNGHVVAPSKPTKVLRTVKKTIHIDSADRDTTKFFTNGDWVAYLPRNYQNVTKIHLKSAEFPPLRKSLPQKILTAAAGNPLAGYVALSGGFSGVAAGDTVGLSGFTNGNVGLNGSYVVRYTDGFSLIVIENSISSVELPLNGSEQTVVLKPGAVSHDYAKGANSQLSTFSSDTPLTTPNYYFNIELAGLNKTDETVIGGNKSTLIDNFFAKIPAMTQTYGSTSFIEYNESSNHDTTAVFSPPIENLDRLQIKTRLHSQQGNSGFIYWTSDGLVATASNVNSTSNYNLTLEIEYLENGFDDFSSFETRLGCRN